MQIAFPLVVAIFGLFMFFVCTGKKEKVGEHLFWCGLLVFLLTGATPLIKILGGN